MKTAKTKKRASSLKKTLHRHVKMTFVPHKANHYRPHLVRRYGLTVVLVVIIAAQAGYNAVTTGSVLGENATMTTESLLADANEERAKSHLQPLEIDERLSRAAYLKGRDMLDRQYWAHTAPDGTTPWDWVEKSGYSYNYAGENLAKNFRTADSVTTAWLSSPEHRKNVLGEQFSDVGFAVVDGELNNKPTTLVVALYGAPKRPGAALAATVSPAPVDTPMSPISRLGIALQSLTPAAIGSVVLLLVAGIVAFAAHAYRKKLPKSLRQSWYRHHGLIKLGGMLSLCLIVVFLYSGGQI